MKSTPEQLAREFARELRLTITGPELNEVVQRNRIETDPRICHSHDFCDANMVLHDVFMRHGMDIAEEGGRDKWGILWDEAWRIAKSAEFWLP